jgi:hypothetical protein
VVRVKQATGRGLLPHSRKRFFVTAGGTGQRPPCFAAEFGSMKSRRRLWRRGSGGVACWPTGTTTLRAALAGRARSRPGRPVNTSGGCFVAAVARIQETVYAGSTGAELNRGALAAPHPGRSLGWPGRSNWYGRWRDLRAIPLTSRRATASCQGGETVRHPLAGRKRPLTRSGRAMPGRRDGTKACGGKREGAHRKDSQVPGRRSTVYE